MGKTFIIKLKKKYQKNDHGNCIKSTLDDIILSNDEIIGNPALIYNLKLMAYY